MDTFLRSEETIDTEGLIKSQFKQLVFLATKDSHFINDRTL